jgi:hypothetical protein
VLHRKMPLIRRSATVLAVTLLVLASGTAHAAGRARTLGVGCFALGIGLKFGGVVVGTGAAETYDDYLLTADQSRLIALREDFRSERRLGRGLSGAGNGLLAAGILFATLSLLRDASDGGDVGEELAQAPPISLTHNGARRELGVLWRYGF